MTEHLTRAIAICYAKLKTFFGVCNLGYKLSLLTDTVDLRNILRPSSIPLTDHNSAAQWLHPEPRTGAGEPTAVTKHRLRGTHWWGYLNTRSRVQCLAFNFCHIQEFKNIQREVFLLISRKVSRERPWYIKNYTNVYPFISVFIDQTHNVSNSMDLFGQQFKQDSGFSKQFLFPLCLWV